MVADEARTSVQTAALKYWAVLNAQSHITAARGRILRRATSGYMRSQWTRSPALTDVPYMHFTIANGVTET
jgi:hypothetical protein